MTFKHAIIENIPTDPLEILKDALKVSFNDWVDEKGTEKYPSVWKRNKSELTFEEAYNIIQNSKPHWVFSFRNMKEITGGIAEDYWDFGGCNLSSNNYGEVFIWIHVDIISAEKIFKKYNLKIKCY